MQFFADKYDSAPPPFKMGKSQAAYVFRNGHSLLTNEKISEQLAAAGEIELIGTSAASWLGVPLRTMTEVIGVLVVQHYEKENAYNQHDIELLISVGDQIAIAIERKRAQEALAIAARRESVMIENALMSSARLMRPGNSPAVSPASLKVWGYPPEELVGRAYIELVAPEDVAKTNEVAAEIMSGSRRLRFENCYRHKNGSMVDIRWTAFWSEAEQLMFCVAHDITERKRTEERQSAILNALPAHICLLDKNGVILEVNEEWRQFAIGNGYRGVDFGVGSNYIGTCSASAGECAEGAQQAAEICCEVLTGKAAYREMEYPCHSLDEERWFILQVIGLQN